MNKLTTYLISLCLLAPCLLANEPEVTAELERRNAYIGDAVQLEIRVQHEPPWVVVPKEVAKTLGEATVLKQSWTLAGVKEGIPETSSVLKLELAWYRHGDVKVPPVEVELSDGSQTKTLSSPELTMEIIKLLEEKDTQAAPAKGQVTMVVPALWPYLLAAGLVLLILVGGIFYWLRKRRKNEGKPVIPPKPPYEEAIRALHDLTSGSLLKEGKYKDFYVAIHLIVRHYYARIFSIHAEEMTSFELESFLEDQASALPGELAHLNRSFQELCDKVKFAKYDPVEAENKETTNRAYQIVELLKPIAAPEEANHVASR